MTESEKATLEAIKEELDYPNAGYPRADKLEEAVMTVLEGKPDGFDRMLRIAQSEIVHIIPRFQ